MQPFSDISFNSFGQVEHKFCTWSDDVWVESLLLLTNFNAVLSPVPLDLFRNRVLFLGINCSPEPSRSLLVHLGSGSNSVDCHVHSLPGHDNAHYSVDVLKYGTEHLSLRLRGGFIHWVTTRMDDAIHVQVQTVHFGVIVWNFLLDQDRRII